MLRIIIKHYFQGFHDLSWPSSYGIDDQGFPTLTQFRNDIESPLTLEWPSSHIIDGQGFPTLTIWKKYFQGVIIYRVKKIQLTSDFKELSVIHQWYFFPNMIQLPIIRAIVGAKLVVKPLPSLLRAIAVPKIAPHDLLITHHFCDRQAFPHLLSPLYQPSCLGAHQGTQFSSLHHSSCIEGDLRVSNLVLIFISFKFFQKFQPNSIPVVWSFLCFWYGLDESHMSWGVPTSHTDLHIKHTCPPSWFYVVRAILRAQDWTKELRLKNKISSTCDHIWIGHCNITMEMKGLQLWVGFLWNDVSGEQVEILKNCLQLTCRKSQEASVVPPTFLQE
ncbi:hypothetical protein VP01_2904g1 [Puccinia sorghi]|uniref:Uncharacterized protein n=1 Tax=Puccinia sorghi TaxID=27349 RepID=A0A0L6V1F8_9BASI|nr:hypothetical protein VP01_2904g1 [Puccinia sorghi]